MSKLFNCVIATGALSLIACSTQAPPGPVAVSLTKEECRAANTCVLSGHLQRSSDGHALIGRMTLDSGDCVNVSIPDQEMLALPASGLNGVRLAGRVVLYPEFETEGVATNFALKGRKIGIGNCGDFFVLVED